MHTIVLSARRDLETRLYNVANVGRFQSLCCDECVTPTLRLDVLLLSSSLFSVDPDET